MYQNRFNFHSNFLVYEIILKSKKAKRKKRLKREEKKTNTNEIEITETGIRNCYSRVMTGQG